MATVYISPTGSGLKDGSSWANAATIQNLDTMITKAGPDGTVLLKADAGAYNLGSKQVTLKHGGSEDHSVTIKGVDSAGHDMNATIVGNRVVTADAVTKQGANAFLLATGADNLNFQNLEVKNVLNAFAVSSNISNIEIGNVKTSNVSRFFEDNSGETGKSATISGLDIHDVEVTGYTKGVIRLAYDTHDVTITNVVGDSAGQNFEAFAMGVHLGGTVHDVVLNKVTMLNNQNFSGTYFNGDGFATEADVHDITFIDTVAKGSTDGGYDLKSDNTTLIRAIADDNNRNFRFWGQNINLIDSVGLDPHNRGGSGGQAQVYLAAGAEVEIVNSKFLDSGSRTKVFDVSDGTSKLVLDDVQVIYGVGGMLKFGGGSLLNGVDNNLIKVVPATGTYSDGANSAGADNGGLIQTPSPPTQVVDNYVAPTVSIVANQSGLAEGQSGGFSFLFTATRTGDLSKASTVDFSVSGSGSTLAGAEDFGGALPSGKIVFEAGQASKVITVQVAGDTTIEHDEGFSVSIGNVTNGSIGTGSASSTIINDDVAIKVVSGSAATNDVLHGPDYHNAFFFDIGAKTGADTIDNFGHDDILITSKALLDANRDGLIGVGANGKLDLDGAVKNSDSVIIQPILVSGLRYLGQNSDGFVYADASVRPKGAIEGKVSDDKLAGDKGDKVSNTFFFDTGLGLHLGSDTISTFGVKDILVTTTKFSDVNGMVSTSGGFVLPAAVGTLEDISSATKTGIVAITNMAGKTVSALEYDGHVTHGGVEYYVYSLEGSSGGLASLHF